MTTCPPTDRARQVLDAVTDLTSRAGYPPTVREFAEAVGLSSPSSVHAHLANLEEHGMIRRNRSSPRSIVVTGDRA